MKKDKLMATILLIIGVGLIILGVINLRKNEKFEKNSSNNLSTPNSEVNNQDDDGRLPDNYASLEEGILLESLTASNSKDEDGNKQTKLIYTLLNNTTNNIPNESLKINIYDNSELIDTYEYEINNLEAYDEVEVETDLEFEYKNTYKYEVIFKDMKKEIRVNTADVYKID